MKINTKFRPGFYKTGSTSLLCLFLNLKMANLNITEISDEVINQTDLVNWFQQYGNVKSSKLLTDGKGKRNGCAMVSYYNLTDAEAAIKKAHGCQINKQGN